jgi:chromosomal replication initiation ATPase DnaA
MTVVLSLWRGPMLIPASPHRSARDIVREVAEGNGLTVDDLTGPSRLRYVCYARHEAMWLIRQVKASDGKPRFSMPFIGSLLGGRDHTTVLHGIREHAKRLAAEKVAA